MSKPYILPGPDRDQRAGTISLMSTTNYDPMAPRPTTPMLIGRFVVYRRPLLRTPLTVYAIMLDGVIVGTQISIPTEADCESAANRQRARLAALEEATRARDARIAASTAKAATTRAKRNAANAARAKVAA